VIIFAASVVSRAQVIPADASPVGLPVSGTLRYDLRFSQTAEFGGGQNGQEWSFVSGDASYMNTAKRLPFNMQYGGGYGYAWSGTTSPGNLFQHLSLSQGIVGRKWNLTASDNVSYIFETPTTGCSGIPGTGEPIDCSGSTTQPDQTVLSLNSRTLDNFTTIEFGDRFSSAWSLNVGGTFGQLRFIDNNGQDTDTWMTNAGVTRRLNARNSLSGQYSFTRYSYSSSNLASQDSNLQLSFTQDNTAQISFSRQWNRQVRTSVSAGPQWVSSSNNAIEPSSTRISASASVTDQLRFGTAGLSYSHGTTGGSGYMLGAESDIASAYFSRGIGKNLTIGATGSYMRSAALSAYEFIEEQNGKFVLVPVNIAQVTNAKYGGVQATRQLGRSMNVFASYTVADQSSGLPSPFSGSSVTILNGVSQVLAFGIGYSPRETHLKK